MQATQTGFGRVFINTPGVNNIFKLHNFMKLGPLDRTESQVEKIYSYNSKNEKINVAIVQTDESEITSSLSGNLPLSKRSVLETLRNKLFNIQIHYGNCSSPTDFYTFESAMILKDVTLLSYNLSELNAIVPSQRAVVTESANLSIGNYYRITYPKFTNIFTISGSSLLNGVVYIERSDCDESISNDVNLIGLLDKLGNTAFVYSLDNGKNWVESGTSGVPHEGLPEEAKIIYANSRVYWSKINGGIARLYSFEASRILNGDTISESELYRTTIGGIKGLTKTSRYIYGVGGTSDGLILKVDLTNEKVEIIEENTVFTTVGLTAIDVLDDNFFVVGGLSGVYGIYHNGVLSSYVIDYPGATAETVQSIKVFDQNNWLIGTDFSVFRTSNRGNTWQKLIQDGTYNNLTFYDNLYGYNVSSDAIYLTLDGGYSWKKVSSNISATVCSAFLSPEDHNQLYICYSEEIKKTI